LAPDRIFENLVAEGGTRPLSHADYDSTNQCDRGLMLWKDRPRCVWCKRNCSCLKSSPRSKVRMFAFLEWLSVCGQSIIGPSRVIRRGHRKHPLPVFNRLLVSSPQMAVFQADLQAAPNLINRRFGRAIQLFISNAPRSDESHPTAPPQRTPRRHKRRRARAGDGGAGFRDWRRPERRIFRDCP
jgi:hypothetical protein